MQPNSTQKLISKRIDLTLWEVLQLGQELTHLTFQQCSSSVWADILTHLAGCQHIICLTILQCDLAHTTYQHGEYHQRYLRITHGNTAEQCLSLLSHLQQLTLKGCRIGPKGYQAIGTLTNLRRLSVGPFDRVSQDWLFPLSGLSELVALEFDSAQREKINAWDWMTAMVCLRSLKCQIYSSDAPFLLKLKQLRELDLRGSGLQSTAFRVLGKLTKLRMLRTDIVLKCSNEGNEALAHLNQLKHLEQLEMMQNEGFKGAALTDVETISCFRQLKKLVLKSVAITSEGIKHLANLTELEHLDLQVYRPASIFIGDEGLQHLHNLVRLRVLNLNSQAITNQGMLCISGFQQLTELDIGAQSPPPAEHIGMRVTAVGCISIGRLTHLKCINIRNNSIGNEGVRSMGSLTLLERLDVANNCIGGEGAYYLIKAFSSLACVCLSSNPIGNQGATIVHRLQFLKRLDLSFTEVQDQAARNLCLCPNSMSHLNLSTIADDLVTNISECCLNRLTIQLPNIRIVAPITNVI